MRWLIAALSLAGAAGCNGEETTAGPSGCIDYQNVDTQACGGPCSFANDMMPLLQASCSLSTACHSNRAPVPIAEGLALGPPATEMGMPVTATQEEIDEVHATIVNGTSVRSTMPLVKPSDPGGSWLLVKVEYHDLSQWGDPGVPVCETAFQACDSTAKGCGVAMPQNSLQLEPERIAIIRAWIADGAQNN